MMKHIVKIISSLKNKLNKYWITVMIFFIFTFLIGENNLFNRISYDRQINHLENEIERYEKKTKEDRQKLKALENDNESLERLAREQYLMTKSNEELFIIKE